MANHASGELNPQPAGAHPARRAGMCLLVLVTCFTVSLVSLRPVLDSPESLIPTTQAGSATVPLFNVWTILRNCSFASGESSSYWNAPIFHPHAGTFAYSEPQPLTILLTPFRMAGASPAWLYNAYLILSLTLNGLFAWMLLTSLNCRFPSSLAGAIGMTLLPMVHDQLDVLQLVPLWPGLWILRNILVLHRLCQNPTTSRRQLFWNAVQTGVALFAAAAASLHHCLFLCILLAFASPAFLWHSTRLRFVATCAVAAGIGGALILPWALPMKKIVDRQSFERESELVSQLSAVPSDLLRVSQRQLLPGTSLSGIRPWYLSPGLCRTLLAAALFPWLLFQKHRGPKVEYSEALFLLFFITAAAALSLGTNLKFGGWQPWESLTQLVPGMSKVRSAFRFGYFYQMAIVLAAATAIDSVARTQTAGRAVLRLRVLCLLAMIITSFEVLPVVPRSVPVPTAQVPEWARTVAEKLPSGAGVLVLPYAPGSGVQDFEQTVRLMISVSEISLPLANGYSGFFPQSHYDWQSLIQSPLTARQLADQMQKDHVNLLVCLAGSLPASLEGDPELPLLFSVVTSDDERGLLVLQLQPTAP
ncbi:MAG: hypothetical protein JNM43_08300 [Planctomycetaceae bacterium]|nr:hypothetical protein [Planctomycetaceae bacterium]